MSHVLDAELDELVRALGISPASVATRMVAVGLTADDLRCLAAIEPSVSANLDRFINSLYERLLAQPEFAPLLVGDAQISRLKAAQRRYFRDLLLCPRDWDYVLRQLRIGAVHYRVHLKPQWYLATYAHFLCDHVPVVLRSAPSAAEGARRVVALVRAAFFDAIIALDAYGLTEEISMRARAVAQSVSTVTQAVDHNDRVAPMSAPQTRSRTLTQITVTTESMERRLHYLGLDGSFLAILPTLAGIITEAAPAILTDFYAMFSAMPETAALVPPTAIERLRQQVLSYWQELAVSRFDRPYGASRMRIGMVHERIGLGPRWYLTGLARQVALFVTAIAAAHPDPEAALSAFLRAVFFDVTYVIEAYLDARAETLLRTDGYANQLVAGLSSAVAIIDSASRLISINPTMRDFLGITPGLLYRMPLEQAVPLPAVKALVEKVRAEALPRAEAVLNLSVPIGAPLGQRLCRLTVAQLEPWSMAAGRPVALMIEDITELARLASMVERNEERYSALLNAVDAAVWEMDTSTWTVELMSAQALALTGYRDVFYVGRSGALVDRVPDQDRARFLSACGALKPGERSSLEHRLVRADEREIWVRCHLRRPEGARTVVVGVSVDITSEKLAEQRARERDLAEGRSQAKSRFLAHMSHEIRTPMNGVLGMSRVLLDGELSPDQREKMQIVLSSAEGLLGIINDLLDLSKVEAGHMTLERTSFALPVVCEEALSVLRLAARTKGVALRCELPADGPERCVGDPVRLRQVLLNLLGNGLKFTDRGAVTLRVEGEGEGRYHFRVIDTGVGVPEARQQQIFEPYMQAEDSTARRFGGTGLGLTIARDLVRLMGGELRVQSALGSGSMFYFTLDLPAATAPAEAPVAAAPTTAPGLRVLVAEDEEISALLIEHYLTKLGHSAERVEDGAAAVAMWRRGDFDLVLMDMQMPGVDGIEATRTIRAEEGSDRRVPIVALTANAMTDYVQRCRDAGMDGHLSKPIDPRTLEEALARFGARSPGGR
jgi:PAS domain S-box-containing protein